MGISGIGCSPADCYRAYSKLVSGKKIETASDGAAQKAIIEKEKAQISGYDAGTKNIQSGKSVLNISEGGLKGIGGYLQKIRDLALQAGNTATVSDSDRKRIQGEIEQMKQGISDIARNTEYNTKKLLDGSNDSFNMVTGPNGSGSLVPVFDSTLKALGIEDFDVTKDFSLKTIDNAIDMVNSKRSEAGAKENALDFSMNYNKIASYNMTGAVSTLEDEDIGKAVIEQKKKQNLELYSIIMKKKEIDNEERKRVFWM